MTAELGKSIDEQTIEAPVMQAKTKIQQILNEDRGRRNMFCKAITKKDNERIKKSYADGYGGVPTIMDLLPINSIHFRPITDLLRGHGLVTQSTLIVHTRDENYISFITRGNRFKIKLIGAMRDLAIAEKNVRTSNKPQA